MGLAASQARLLTITARLADNELRSQTINNAKMRLATQSSKVSDEYVSALNNAQLMFTNMNNDGLSRNQALTFNALTAYSPYNTQYGITNSAGLLMVSERDAKNFEKHHNDLDGFLGEYGLKWDTTFFGNEEGTDLSEKLVSFYGTDEIDGDSTKGYNYGDFFAGMKNGDLKKLYIDSLTEQASIEALNYDQAANAYYNEVKNLYVNTAPILREAMLGDSSAKTEAEIADAVASHFSSLPYEPKESAVALRNFLLNGSGGINFDNEGNKFTLNNISQYLTDEAIKYLEKMINSLTDADETMGDAAGFADGNTWGDPGDPVAVDAKNYNMRDPNNPQYEYISVQTKQRANNGELSNDYGYGWTFTIAGITVHIDEPDELVDDGEVTILDKDGKETGKTVEVKTQPTSFKNTYVTVASTDSPSNPPSSYAAELEEQINDWMAYNDYDTKHKDYFDDDDKRSEFIKRLAEECLKSSYNDTDEKDGGSSKTQTCLYRYINGEIVRVPMSHTRKETYKLLMEEYFQTILNTPGFLNTNAIAGANSNAPTLEGYTRAQADFRRYDTAPVNGTNSGSGSLTDRVNLYPKYLLDFELMMRYEGKSIKDYGSDAFKSVLNTHLADLMLDVLGEPKYAWIDTEDPNGSSNPDVKAQWYSNLFTRMQHGYKVLENGLASSKEWMEYALESGLVTMEQVDKSYNWLALDYKACANIYEESDTSDIVAKAEAKYNRAMNDIKQKDNMYDLQLKNIDTEHSALQTEYDSVKRVMDKNIERTMKFDQSA